MRSGLERSKAQTMKKTFVIDTADKAVQRLKDFERDVRDIKHELLEEIEASGDGLIVAQCLGAAAPAGRGVLSAAAILKIMAEAQRTLEVCEGLFKPSMKDAPEQLSRVRTAYANHFLSMARDLHLLAKI